MPEAAAFLLLVLGALVASVLSAVAGFGGAVVLLPVLTLVFGVRDAVPILTVAQLVGNASRVWFNRREVCWPVVDWFAVGSVPLGVLGGVVFATAPLPVLTRAIGAFLLLAVACRHLIPKTACPMPRWAFAPVGAANSFVSAVAGTAGPLTAPFFLAFGLVKGAYIGTEAVTAVVTHATKLAVYGTSGLMTAKGEAVGLLLGAVMVAGTYLGKRQVDRVSERTFVLVVEVVLVAAGVYFLVA
jgi:uncharacterized membrane protein YfcA